LTRVDIKQITNVNIETCEVIVRFVDVGGIVDHQCFIFLFI